MPNIRCVECGNEIYIDAFGTPYKAELACPYCHTKMEVYVTTSQGTQVKRKYPKYDELERIWDNLTIVERNSIKEASLSLGSGAYTASELMSLRTIESVLRRIYRVDETFGQLILRMENDDRLKDLKGILDYFKDVRNRVAHPDKTSSKLDAESTFQMTKRLILELIEKLS